MRFRKHLINQDVFILCKSEVASRKSERGFVKHTDNELFSEHRGKRGNTEIKLFTADDHIDSSVLRYSPLRYVQPRHNLDTGAYSGIGVYRELCSLLQITVNTVTYLNHFFKRLNMNITRSIRYGFLNNGIHQSHGRVIDNIVFYDFIVGLCLFV